MQSSRTSSPPFRAEHIGSLRRPKAVLDGENPDSHIVEAIRWQERLGLEVVTDGEFRRESWCARAAMTRIASSSSTSGSSTASRAGAPPA
jgi:methionine synthase II (cobalamin-independent)